MKKIVLGLMAHVDAGKTTLAESILYTSGEIRKPGRVDHKDAFLDTDAQERERGITIFSKQAHFTWKDGDFTLLDTPGHVDFSAEMERTLQVLDYAILIISGADGVQGHTLTLWRLLERYKIPVFLFVNKMDQPGTCAMDILQQLQKKLDTRCLSFEDAGEDAWCENIAVCDDKLLETYLEWQERGDGPCPVDCGKVTALIRDRKVFPCYFGSALKMEGVETLLNGVETYTRMPSYAESFGARVFKIARDGQGNRLTFLKITGGNLKVKQTISVTGKDTFPTVKDGEKTEEKIDQIRVYAGEKYTLVQEVTAGEICVVTGPVRTFCGEGLGCEKEHTVPVLEPVMTYRLEIPEENDIHTFYDKLCQLEEEEPQLHVVWKEQLSEIHVQLMGEVQTEVLRTLIKNRFDTEVDFAEGSIAYKETISDVVEGVGHFEPLRHYAEVHLLLEPGERGSGMQFRTNVSEDELDKNWQRLILTHLEEKEHVGVLTGSPITDMVITLVAGKAHTKHTEGGDFRQATYRAVRQGLCKAKSVLLEPVYAFRLEVPNANIGRAMTDMQTKGGRFEAPLTLGETAVITGVVPAAKMHGYQTQMLAYTGGRGQLTCAYAGYEPCQDAEEVITQIGYEAEHDLQNPSSSVFCSHGAGVVIEWDQVENYMHLDSYAVGGSQSEDGSFAGRDMEGIAYTVGYARRRSNQKSSTSEDFIGQDEVEEIFERTFGKKQREKQGWAKTIQSAQTPAKPYKGTENLQDEFLLVDGYNIIFAWDSLKELAATNLDGARGKLMDLLSDFQGTQKAHIILVFDAYKVRGNPGSTSKYHNIDVVYTKEAETADQYIEKVTHRIGRKNRVRVATSDGLEQLIILGAGALRISAKELEREVFENAERLREEYLQSIPESGEKTYLLDDISQQVREFLEQSKT